MKSIRKSRRKNRSKTLKNRSKTLKKGKRKYNKNKSKSKSNHMKKGGSHIYYMSNGESKEINETTPDGKPFFRKVFDGSMDDSINEFKIITILQEILPHPNIVTFYDINPGESIDMEELITYSTDEDYAYNYLENKKELAKQIDAMKKVKKDLQELGIIYLDWKFDNIGKSLEKDGDYKLFDFDNSGWIDIDTNEWIIKPTAFLKSFTGPEKRYSPIELDDWAFDRYIIQEAKRM